MVQFPLGQKLLEKIMKLSVAWIKMPEPGTSWINEWMYQLSVGIRKFWGEIFEYLSDSFRIEWSEYDFWTLCAVLNLKFISIY